MTLRRPRRWADLNRVERVDAYTRVSLHLMLWLFGGSILLAAVPEADGATETAVLVSGTVAVTMLGGSAMGAVMARYPAPYPLPWRWLGPLVAVSALFLLVVGTSSSTEVDAAVTAVLVFNGAAALGGVPDNRIAAGLVVAAGVFAGFRSGDVAGVLVGLLLSSIVVFAIRASLWLLEIVTELGNARHALARLAVAEERLRFSRDVHDVLGRRLSTIAVQAELAATLAARGDDRAAEKMLEVRGVAHEALAEARELARGYRPTDLTTELEGARSLLRSAGIDVTLAVDVVPRAWHEAAGWVVRESVTNVLRHSVATHVAIAFIDEELRVSNDGVQHVASGPDTGGAGGTGGAGLDGLRERLTPLGATLTTTASAEAWTIAVRLPGSGPLSATTTGSPA